MEPDEAEMDQLLRRLLDAPVPHLSPDFDRRLLATVRRKSQPLDLLRRALLTSYGFVSVAASVVVMRDQGLAWALIGEAVVGTLVLCAAISVPVRRRSAKHS